MKNERFVMFNIDSERVHTPPKTINLTFSLQISTKNEELIKRYGQNAENGTRIL
jgi:hypothetical protein